MLGALESIECRVSHDPEPSTLDPLHSNSDLTPIGRQMLRLPMHPRYSRMLVEAAQYNCIPAAALCAALVSGRDLLMRLGRDDKHIAEARELFEASDQSDFYTLIRAYQFARKSNFSVESCRRYGIHAQTARQVEQTFEQILTLARQLRTTTASSPSPLNGERAGVRGESVPGADEQLVSATKSVADDPLLRCIMA